MHFYRKACITLKKRSSSNTSFYKEGCYFKMTVFLIVGFIILLSAGGIVTYLGSLPEKKRKRLYHTFYVKIFEFLSNFFLTKGRTRSLTHKISLLSIYRQDQIPELTVKFYMKAFLASAILITAGFILCNDIISKLMCVVYAVVINSVVSDKQIDSTYKSVLKAILRGLSSIEQEYMKSKNIPDSLSNAKVDSILRRAVDDIYAIITGSSGDLQLQQFYASMPFRPLQTLAGVCYNLNMYGDTVDNQNISSFVRALTILRGDVNAQIEKLALQKAKFGVMEYLPIVPIVAVGPIENYFISIIPGVALMYNGILCFILRTSVFLVSVIAYSIISRINSTVSVKEDDRSEWMFILLKIKQWKSFIKGLYPKKEKSRFKIEYKLKMALSKMKLEHYYTKKVVFATASFFMSLVIIFISVQLGKDFTGNTTAQLLLIAGEERTQTQKNYSNFV